MGNRIHLLSKSSLPYGECTGQTGWCLWVLEGEEENGEFLSCCLSAKQVHYRAGVTVFGFSFSVTQKYFLSHVCQMNNSKLWQTWSPKKYFSSVRSGLGAGNSCWYCLCLNLFFFIILLTHFLWPQAVLHSWGPFTCWPTQLSWLTFQSMTCSEHAVPLAVPPVLLSHLQFECSFPSHMDTCCPCSVFDL